MKQFLVIALLILGAQVQAYPGFSDAPVTGSSLEVADNENIQSVISQLDETKKFEIAIENSTSNEIENVNVILMVARPTIEADPEIPTHLLSVRGENDHAASNIVVNRMSYITSVSKISSNRLRIEGIGGSAHECTQYREFDIELSSRIDSSDGATIYEAKYLNVVERLVGNRCEEYSY